MSAIKIFSHAPTRIDLAGGTLDIWPIYLFLKNPLTLNLAINLHAEARVESTKATSGMGTITLRSEDQNTELKIRWEDLSQLEPPPALELHVKLLRHFAQTQQGQGTDFLLSTRARSPAGAGLGGSSALSIAIVGALGTWATGRRIDPIQDGERFIELVRDVETTVIRVPAGLQDYYGAMYGGLQALHWLPRAPRREALATDILSALEKRLILFYSGQSRNSGINNWALFKGYIDRDPEIQTKFAQISEATQKLQSALIHHQWAEAGRAIADEWKVRKTLAPGMSTLEIDAAFQKAKELFPQSSGKICGAGGGGCFFFYFPDPLSLEERSRLIQAIEAVGVRNLSFTAVPQGLEIRNA